MSYPVSQSTPRLVYPLPFVNSQSQVSGHATPKAHAHSDKRKKRNLMLMGSAAVVAVYSAGFFHTAEASAKMTAAEQARPERPTERESSAPDAIQAATRSISPAAPVANLPVATPAPLPPVATASPLQTPAPAPSPAPAAVPSTPAPVSAVAAMTTPPPVVTAVALVSAPSPVPASPVKVAAMPAAPAPTAPTSTPAKPAAPVPTVPTSTPAKPAAQTAALAITKKYKDGAYFGWGSCRLGDLKVIVEMKDDVIVSANIAECYTRYSKNVISRLPGQLVARQNPTKLDRISGASDSSDAYYYAVVEALKAAKL